jgi:hypothetical protein
MNFKFEFLNFHINHLTQLGMINIILKCLEKTYVKKFTIYTTIRHGFWLLFLYSHPFVNTHHLSLPIGGKMLHHQQISIFEFLS